VGDQDGYGALYAAICDEWNKAEEDVKRAEQVCDEVIIPSIMELRYAGRRLAQALEIISKSGSPAEVEKLLHDARFNCHRARHDAIDASTTQIARTLKIAVKRLKYKVILAAFPTFPSLFGRLQDVRIKIVTTRGSATTRDDIYEAVETSDFPTLLALFGEFQKCEPMMISMAKRERVERLLAWIGIIIGGIAILIEIFRLVYLK
jgi:hypothetical protein